MKTRHYFQNININILFLLNILFIYMQTSWIKRLRDRLLRIKIKVILFRYYFIDIVKNYFVFFLINFLKNIFVVKKMSLEIQPIIS